MLVPLPGELSHSPWRWAALVAVLFLRWTDEPFLRIPARSGHALDLEPGPPVPDPPPPPPAPNCCPDLHSTWGALERAQAEIQRWRAATAGLCSAVILLLLVCGWFYWHHARHQTPRSAGLRWERPRRGLQAQEVSSEEELDDTAAWEPAPRPLSARKSAFVRGHCVNMAGRR